MFRPLILTVSLVLGTAAWGQEFTRYATEDSFDDATFAVETIIPRLQQVKISKANRDKALPCLPSKVYASCSLMPDELFKAGFHPPSRDVHHCRSCLHRRPLSQPRCIRMRVIFPPCTSSLSSIRNSLPGGQLKDSTAWPWAAMWM